MNHNLVKKTKNVLGWILIIMALLSMIGQMKILSWLPSWFYPVLYALSGTLLLWRKS